MFWSNTVGEFTLTRDRSSSESADLGRAREEALSRFLELGFPTTRDEEWRFTSVAPIAGRAFAPALSSPNAGHRASAPMRLPGVFGAELVFVNGRYAAALSSVETLPPGVQVGSLAAHAAARSDGVESHLARVAPIDRRAFVAFNTAFFTDGAYIHIPAHTVVEKPIHVLFVSTGEANGRPAMTHPRVLAVLGDDSQASIVESYVGSGRRRIPHERRDGNRARPERRARPLQAAERGHARRTTWAQFS